MKRKISFEDESLFIQEYAFVDLNGDRYIDLVAFEPENNRTFFFNGKSLKKRILNIQLEHPRGFAHCDIDGDKIDDLIIADHGEDRPPFVGGFSYVIWGSHSGDFHFSHLNKNRAYSFSATCFEKEIYLSNSGRPELPESEIYDFRESKGHEDNYHYSFAPLLGENGFIPKKFLASLLIDIDGDNKRDLILGKEQESLNKDLIFWGSRSTFAPHPEVIERSTRESWATVDIQTVKVKNKISSIVLATHSPDMKEGVVELWEIGEKHPHLKRVFQPSLDIKGEFWIPWVSTGDLNHDGREDLSFAIWGSEQGFIGPRFYIYLNLPSGWKNISRRYLSGFFSPIHEQDYWNRVEILDFNQDGKDELLFIGFDGKGYLY